MLIHLIRGRSRDKKKTEPQEGHRYNLSFFFFVRVTNDQVSQIFYLGSILIENLPRH